MSCCKAIRPLSHVGCIVENVLLYEDCWRQLLALSGVTETNTFHIVHFTICYGLVYKLNSAAKVFERSWIKGTYRLFTLSELPANSDFFWIQPNWEQASFIPLLYIKAAPGDFPLRKPHMAAPDICLHFRAYEGLHCNRASLGLNKCI